MTGQLNQDNSNLYTLLKKIEKNIVNVEKVIQQTDKKNERLEGNSLIFKLNYIWKFEYDILRFEHFLLSENIKTVYSENQHMGNAFQNPISKYPH